MYQGDLRQLQRKDSYIYRSESIARKLSILDEHMRLTMTFSTDTVINLIVLLSTVLIILDIENPGQYDDLSLIIMYLFVFEVISKMMAFGMYTVYTVYLWLLYTFSVCLCFLLCAVLTTDAIACFYQ